jgi:type IV pilus secretin PilQ/predicted competence protein
MRCYMKHNQRFNDFFEIVCAVIVLAAMVAPVHPQGSSESAEQPGQQRSAQENTPSSSAGGASEHYLERPDPADQLAHQGLDGNLSPIERFSVDNADVRSVLKQLSEFSGVDIVLHEKVAGTVTLTVSNKTWKDILSIVCRISNLTPMRESSYIYVLPSTEWETMMKNSQQVQAQALGVLKREVIQLKNVPAAEMKTSIMSLLSERGKVTVVERNNALIIFDGEDNINQIKKTINELDVETDQVSISCKIIEVSSGVLQNIGIQWGYFDRLGGVNVSGQHLPFQQTSGSSASSAIKSVVAGALEKLTYGIVSQDKFSLALEYLFQNSKAEMVAQPQITTLDNKEAKIFMGSQVPIKYNDVMSANVLVKMIDAGTELTVTPHITSEQRIMLALYPKKRSYSLTGDGQPIINEQSAQTNVVVTDGETVVIAGLTSNEYVLAEEGIPILKDIPLIGNLFKRTKKTLDKKDLIIFVTPHIISKKAQAALDETGAAKTIEVK